MCQNKNLHAGHTLVDLSDEDTLKKENLSIEGEIKDYNDMSQRIVGLKNKIENEIIKLDQLFDKTLDDLKKSYKKKYEMLLKEENNLKEQLQNKVTKTKGQLENFLSEINENIRIGERINKGIKKLKNEEKSMIRILSYISKINTSKKNMKKLDKESLKSIKFSYKRDKSDIKYEEYYFNGMVIPKNIEFKEVGATNLKIIWNVDDMKLINMDKNQIKYKVEMRKENCNDNFKEIYQGNNCNYFVNNLSSNTTYEFRICSFCKDTNGEWSQIHKITTTKIDSLILTELNRYDDFLNKIKEWSGYKKIDLLFRGTRDGMTAKDFHNKCDNQGPTISLFKNQKGHVFGGYASISWTSSNGNQRAPNSFLFSLTNIYNTQPTKFPCKNDGKEVYHEPSYGPIFGESGLDFYLLDNFSQKNKAYSQFPKSFEDLLGKGYSIFTSNENSNNNFTLKEIEIFKLSN